MPPLHAVATQPLTATTWQTLSHICPARLFPNSWFIKYHDRALNLHSWWPDAETDDQMLKQRWIYQVGSTNQYATLTTGENTLPFSKILCLNHSQGKMINEGVEWLTLLKYTMASLMQSWSGSSALPWRKKMPKNHSIQWCRDVSDVMCILLPLLEAQNLGTNIYVSSLLIFKWKSRQVYTH